MNDRVAVIGVGWTGFTATSPDLSYKEMSYAAAIKAYANAGVDPRRDIESFVTVAEDFHEGTSIFDEYTPDQLGAVLKPMHTICGDGLHGLAAAYMLIKTGQFSMVAVEGHSKASNVLTLPEVNAYAQDSVLNRPLRLNSHFIAGLDMNRFLFETGMLPEHCAAVTAKNRSNALRNPSAPYGADLTIEEALAGPMVSWPLNARQIAKHADGAIVLVLASEALARTLSDKAITILGIGWCNDSPSLENRAWGHAIYAQKAMQMACRQAGIHHARSAIDFAEVDDLYAYKELQALEALGLYGAGESGAATLDGATRRDGDLPVNISGGSQGRGDLLEANGLARALEVVLQLRGEAGARQIPKATVGLAQSWRGAPTASGAVAILAN